MSGCLTKWKVLKQEFSPTSLYVLCSCLWILTCIPLLTSSSLLNVRAFLLALLLKCAFLPPALTLSACLSSFLPKRNPSLHNVKLDRMCFILYRLFLSFLLARKKFLRGIFDTTLLNCQLLLQLFSGSNDWTHFSLPAQFPSRAIRGEVWGCACDSLLFPSPTGREKTPVARDVNQVLNSQ